ncbi:MAG: iron ABC transporter permease [Wenzhouxiangellaceae bacterium]
MNKRALISLLALVLLSLISLALALSLGSYATSPAGIWQGLWDPAAPAHELIWQLRLPRALAAWLTGALLALAGVLMQVLLRNPLADPYVLGTSGGAACLALASMSLGLAIPTPVAAFSGALIAILLVFVLARGDGPWNSTRLLLTGAVSAAAWGALISLLLSLAPEQQLRGMLFWLMGDLSWPQVNGWMWLSLLLLIAVTGYFSRALNVMAAGDITAALLGEQPQRLGWILYLSASLATAIAVTIAGSVGFVGLVVPHLLRLVLGADHRLLIPAAVMFGGAFLVCADTLARSVIAPQQLPVGVVTALIGAPLFLLLLRRSQRL